MSEMVDSVAKAMSDKAGLVWDILPDSADMACGHGMPEGCRSYWRAMASIAILAADKWDAEQRVDNQTPMYRLAMAQSQVSTGLDDALQAELDHPPASILGKE